MAESSVETDPGYGFLEEGMAVEEDHMGEGALRFTLVGLLFLIIAIIITVKWAQYEGQVAAHENAVYEPSPLLRQMEAQATEKLNQYGVVDPENDRYRIPIERAMTIIATEHAEERGGEE
jgi:hypothetical protein